jgi:glycosyltransferase involved in cell wall biosynthesis
MAYRSLAGAFPFAEDKLVASRLGLYTTYPRSADARIRVRAALGVQPNTTLALFFGGIRPYKNVETAIAALAADSSGAIELLIAGHESGYPDSDPHDQLGRTRRLVQQSGVADRVHLMPGIFGYADTAALLEAADVVLLPYLESWGSGLVCLAMSFGKPVIVTRTGGMEEYVEDYQAAVVLDEPTRDAVLAALHQTREQYHAGGSVATRPAHLEWSHIVRDLVPSILPPRRRGSARRSVLRAAG